MQRDGIALAEGLFSVGESCWLRTSMIGEEEAVHLFQLYPGICLASGEKHGERQSR
jgi:hypothetical protein